MRYLKKVKEFRDAVGLKDQPADLHDALIGEELAELADALADSVFVIAGKRIDAHMDDAEYRHRIGCIMESAYWAGVDLDKAVELVHESNMSKLCTEDELEDTQAKYEELGVQVEFRMVEPGLFACYSLGGHPDYPKGKLLKSVGFHEPRWSETAAWILGGGE